MSSFLPIDDKSSDKYIDFKAAGLYVPGVQTIVSVVSSSFLSVLSCWVIPAGAISAVRTLAIVTFAGSIIVFKPARIGSARGVVTIFSALRPCMLVYVTSLVLEQLVHTCVDMESSYEHGFGRFIFFNVMMTICTAAAFFHSASPRKNTEAPFFVTCLAFIAVAILPPPSLALSGPLCSPCTLFGAAERILRAFLFAAMYVVLVYSSAPISHSARDVVICVSKSSASSVWILGASVYTLPAVCFQLPLALYSNFAANSEQYEFVDTGNNSEDGKESDLGRVSTASTSDISPKHLVPQCPPSVQTYRHEVEDALSLMRSTSWSQNQLKPTFGKEISFCIKSETSRPKLSEQRIAEIAASIP